MNRNNIDLIKRHPFVTLAIFCLIFTATQEISPWIAKPDSVFLIVGILLSAILLALYLVIMKIRGKLTFQLVCIAVFAFGMILRLAYILYTGIYDRQQDLYSFDGGEGHAGYIVYIYNHLNLPNIDPRINWQFYHPPLQHIISAIWLQWNTLIGINWDQALENLQILSFFYSGCYLIYTYRIFRLLIPKGRGIIIAFLIVTLQPTFILLSGSINNDMLSILLIQAAVYYGLFWYRNSTMTSILKLACAIGFGMMTKLSVGMIAPAIAFLFMMRFLQDRPQKKLLLKQFTFFGLVTIPLGLWWGIRNAILFNMPLTYVPSLGDHSHQYIGHYSIVERLLDFSLYQFQSVYVAWGTPYFEHNIFIGLLKTSVFGEQGLSSPDSLFYVFAMILFYLNMVIVLLALVSMIYLLFRHFAAQWVSYKIFITLIYLTFMASYIQFCFAYPHTCTQNIRYVTPAIWIGALAIGLVATGLKKKTRDII